MDIILGMIIGVGIFLFGAYVGLRLKTEPVEVKEEKPPAVPMTLDGRFFSTTIAMQGLEEKNK